MPKSLARIPMRNDRSVEGPAQVIRRSRNLNFLPTDRLVAGCEGIVGTASFKDEFCRKPDAARENDWDITGTVGPRERSEGWWFLQSDSETKGAVASQIHCWSFARPIGAPPPIFIMPPSDIILDSLHSITKVFAPLPFAGSLLLAPVSTGFRNTVDGRRLNFQSIADGGDDKWSAVISDGVTEDAVNTGIPVGHTCNTAQILAIDAGLGGIRFSINGRQVAFFRIDVGIGAFLRGDVFKYYWEAEETLENQQDFDFDFVCIEQDRICVDKILV